MSYTIEEHGSKYTLGYTAYFKDAEGNIVSPWHDIPLWADEAAGIVNMVVEVPRWTNAKMEITTGAELNPIKQDVKKGKVRFVHNCFPHHGYIWNYGAIPQTWENPKHVDSRTECGGDNDPLDICDISSVVAKTGDVKQVKILGVFAMIDEGETDWKVLGIDVADPKASKINDLADIETHYPGMLAATNEWFRIYKMPAGKPENVFAFNGEAKDRAFALEIVKETHDQWAQLLADPSLEPKAALSCTTGESAGKVDPAKATEVAAAAGEAEAAAEIPSSVDDWHYVRLD